MYMELFLASVKFVIMFRESLFSYSKMDTVSFAGLRNRAQLPKDLGILKNSRSFVLFSRLFLNVLVCWKKAAKERL